MCVDRHPDRLRLAEEIGRSRSTNSKQAPVEIVLEHTGGHGRRPRSRGGRLAGHDPRGHEVPASTMNDLVASVRAWGAIGVVGVFRTPETRDFRTI